MSDNVAVVAGPTGIVGRRLVEHLSSLPDWRVIGLARRGGNGTVTASTCQTDHAPIGQTRQMLDQPTAHYPGGARDDGDVIAHRSFPADAPARSPSSSVAARFRASPFRERRAQTTIR